MIRNNRPTANYHYIDECYSYTGKDIYEKPIIISIEGNIGVGKSTLLSKIKELSLKNSYDINCLFEPVKQWEDVRDPITNDNMITKYYLDPEKYAFPFQIMAYSTQVNQLLQAVSDLNASKIILTERSLESNHEVFTKMLYNNNLMEDTLYQIYKMNADTHKISYNDSPNLNTDAYIYLKSSPETCLERIHKRDRSGETKITLDYLKDCHEYHEKWLNKISPQRCYVLDMDNPINEDDIKRLIDFTNGVYTNITMCPPNPPESFSLPPLPKTMTYPENEAIITSK